MDGQTTTIQYFEDQTPGDDFRPLGLSLFPFSLGDTVTARLLSISFVVDLDEAISLLGWGPSPPGWDNIVWRVYATTACTSLDKDGNGCDLIAYGRTRVANTTSPWPVPPLAGFVCECKIDSTPSNLPPFQIRGDNVELRVELTFTDQSRIVIPSKQKYIVKNKKFFPCGVQATFSIEKWQVATGYPLMKR